MMISQFVKKLFQDWKTEEDGAVAVETILMLPILAWTYFAMMQFFHAYRHESISFKANITIADMFSREADYISPSYIDGAKSLLDFLSPIDDDPELRVTAFRWNEDDSEYQVAWSKERGSRGALTTDDLAGETNRIPIMYDGEMALLVETWIDYEPIFNIGMTGREMNAFTVISPRFTTQVCYNVGNDPSTQEC